MFVADDTGAALVELLRGTESEAVIAAPFIKVAALKRVLDAIPNQVKSITCVVRWDPYDIAVGVSDIEIWDLIKTIPSASLSMHSLLHAKYFRSDDSVLVGSANVTFRALGWSSPSNLELLIAVDRQSNGMVQFETTLMDQSLVVTDAIRDGVVEAADKISETPLPLRPDAATLAEGLDDQIERSDWIPQCSRPDVLYSVYNGDSVEHLVGWTLSSAQSDLRAVRAPLRLSTRDFNQQVIKSVLLGLPITREVLNRATAPITPSQGQEIIRLFRSEESHDLDELQHWMAYRTWLLRFLSDMVREPHGSEDLVRGQIL